MRTLALQTAALLMLAGCGPTTPATVAGDPDTDGAGARTMAFGKGSLTVAGPIAGRPMAEPRYLPAWAPFYPGAEIEQKLVQRDGHGIIGRGTEMRTHDPIDTVVAFYAAAVARSGERPVSQSREARMASFVFASANGYTNSIIIRARGDDGCTITIARATDS